MLTLPLCIGPDGQFVKASGADAVFESVALLIGVMASTNQNFWPHAPWFGLLDAFQESKAGVDLPRIADAINTALSELGCTDVRVRNLRSPGLDSNGSRGFDIDLVMADGTSARKHFQS